MCNLNTSNYAKDVISSRSCGASSSNCSPLHGFPCSLVSFKVNLFSFCRLLQNHTRTTSLSMPRFVARMPISLADGFGFAQNSFSKTLLTETSIAVLFFRFRLASNFSLSLPKGLSVSASSSHLINRGLSLHMFLKLSCKASKRQIVVWLNTFP